MRFDRFLSVFIKALLVSFEIIKKNKKKDCVLLIIACQQTELVFT